MSHGSCFRQWSKWGKEADNQELKVWDEGVHRAPFLNVYTKHNQDRNRKALNFHPSGLCIHRKWRERGGAANLELRCHIQRGLGKCQDLRHLLISGNCCKVISHLWKKLSSPGAVGCIQQRVLTQKSTNQTDVGGGRRAGICCPITLLKHLILYNKNTHEEIMTDTHENNQLIEIIPEDISTLILTKTTLNLFKGQRESYLES